MDYIQRILKSNHIETLVLPMNGQMADQNGRKRRDIEDFSVKLSTIRIWMHEKEIGKLTRILWAGQGNRLCQQTSRNARMKRFLAAVPYVMNAIKEVHQAVVDNNLETLLAKLEPPVPQALITAKDSNGLTVIHKAAGLGHTKILEYLLSVWPKGAHEVDITGKTPLHWAASAKNNMRCYTILTEAGCDEDAVDYRMKSPSYYRHKPHEIERAFLVYIPDAPRVSPDIATDWDALNEEILEAKKGDRKASQTTNGSSVRTNEDSIENTSELDLNDGISANGDDISKDIESEASKEPEESAPAEETLEKIEPDLEAEVEPQPEPEVEVAAEPEASQEPEDVQMAEAEEDIPPAQEENPIETMDEEKPEETLEAAEPEASEPSDLPEDGNDEKAPVHENSVQSRSLNETQAQDVEEGQEEVEEDEQQKEELEVTQEEEEKQEGDDIVTNEEETPAANENSEEIPPEKPEEENEEKLEENLEEKLEEISAEAGEKLNEISAEAGAKLNEISAEAGEKLEEILGNVEEKLEEMSTEAQEKLEEISGVVEEKLEELLDASVPEETEEPSEDLQENSEEKPPEEAEVLVSNPEDEQDENGLIPKELKEAVENVSEKIQETFQNFSTGCVETFETVSKHLKTKKEKDLETLEQDTAELMELKNEIDEAIKTLEDLDDSDGLDLNKENQDDNNNNSNNIGNVGKVDKSVESIPNDCNGEDKLSMPIIEKKDQEITAFLTSEVNHNGLSPVKSLLTESAKDMSSLINGLKEGLENIEEKSLASINDIKNFLQSERADTLPPDVIAHAGETSDEDEVQIASL